MAKKKDTPPSPPPPPQPEAQHLDARFQNILTLITLLKSARHKRKKSELQFQIVNQTYNLVPYRHCVFWECLHGDHISIETASGLVHLDEHGPYTVWLRKTISHFVSNKVSMRETADKESADEIFARVQPLTASNVPPQEMAEWKEWASAHALLITLKNRQDKIGYGLWIDRETPFTNLEIAFLEDLCDGYAHALQHFTKGSENGPRKGFWRSLLLPSGSHFWKVVFVLFLTLFIPVRMSVTAPAEIVPHSPFIVSVPFDGIIDKVEVTPGQAVKKGDLLVRMESTVLKNKSEMSAREMETAQVAFSKTEREALVDRTKLAELSLLKLQVEKKGAEKKYADELLAKSEIRAQRDGIVIFSDANALRGKPVQTGEQLMLLADPEDSELLIRVPVEAMIRIDESVQARFFLNVTPLGFRQANYTSIGYQATPDPDGLLTYKVRARFEDEKGEERPRIGWTGTGKVYGERTLLGFNIMRRPVVTMRRKLGI